MPATALILIAIDEHLWCLYARDGATAGAAPAPARAQHARAHNGARPLLPQVLLRLPRAPAVVADAEAAATCLFDEFPSLCVVVISLPGIAIVARYSAGALIATDDLPCMQVLTTARSNSLVTLRGLAHAHRKRPDAAVQLAAWPVHPARVGRAGRRAAPPRL